MGGTWGGAQDLTKARQMVCHWDTEELTLRYLKKYSGRVAHGVVRSWVWQAKVSSGVKAISQERE